MLNSKKILIYVMIITAVSADSGDGTSNVMSTDDMVYTSYIAITNTIFEFSNALTSSISSTASAQVFSTMTSDTIATTSFDIATSVGSSMEQTSTMSVFSTDALCATTVGTTSSIYYPSPSTIMTTMDTYTATPSATLTPSPSVAQLSINGKIVASVTDRGNEPQHNVEEDAGSITLCITLEHLPEEKDRLTINCFTREGTALDGTDYRGIRDTFTFTNIGEFICTTISIIDNSHQDGDRYFLFGITSQDGVDIWIQIFIWDDDQAFSVMSTGDMAYTSFIAPTYTPVSTTSRTPPPSTIMIPMDTATASATPTPSPSVCRDQLSINGTNVTSVTNRTNEPHYHVKEDAGSITLCIRLECLPEGKDNLTIDYLTIGGTALDGRDYQGTNDVFTFTNIGQPMYVTIQILDNVRQDGKRFFLFGITNGDGVDIWIQIFIRDDDMGLDSTVPAPTTTLPASTTTQPASTTTQPAAASTITQLTSITTLLASTTTQPIPTTQSTQPPAKVVQLSINGTNVTSVTNRTNEPKYHVKEDAGSITFCIRLECLPEEKDNLTIDYLTIGYTASDGRDYRSTSSTNDTFTFTYIGQSIYVTIPIIDNMHHDGKKLFLFGITSECGVDIWIQIFIWDDEWEMYGDPHFSVPLLHGGKLCYSIQGIPGLPFNLLSSKHLIINSLFIDSINDPTQATWIGKLAVILKNGKIIQPIVFDSVNQSIKIEGKGYFKPQFIKQIVINNSTDSIAVKATRGLAKQSGNPSVTVLLSNPKAVFDVIFHKDHLDVNWKMQADEIDGSHGLLGQFMVKGVEVDPVKQMLIQPELEPVPVELSNNWNTEDKCWLAKNVGTQGEGLIRGSIYDYIVATIESADTFKL